MKKNPVRVVKKNSQTINSSQAAGEHFNQTSKSTAQKITQNVAAWIDEMRERKNSETIQSFSLYAKVVR